MNTPLQSTKFSNNVPVSQSSNSNTVNDGRLPRRPHRHRTPSSDKNFFESTGGLQSGERRWQTHWRWQYLGGKEDGTMHGEIQSVQVVCGPTPRYSRPKSNSLSTISYHYNSFNILPSSMPPLFIHDFFSIIYQVWKFQSRRMKTRKVDFRKRSKISRGHGRGTSGLNCWKVFFTIAVDGVDVGWSSPASFRFQISGYRLLINITDRGDDSQLPGHSPLTAGRLPVEDRTTTHDFFFTRAAPTSTRQLSLDGGSSPRRTTYRYAPT